MIVVDIPVNPRPQQRPVVTFRHGRAPHTITPQATREFYEEVRWRLREAGVKRPLSGPLFLTARFWRQCRRGQRGDLDNVLKATLDACNGFLFEDDEQITDVRATFIEWGKDVVGRIELEIVQLAKGAA